MQPSIGFFKRIYLALGYSIAGLKTAFQEEASFRQELYLSCIMLPTLFFLPISPAIVWATVVAHLLVIIIEIINSAIEAVVDLASPERHELAKKAKDMASAAVLLTLIPTTILWGYIVTKSVLFYLGTK